MNFIQELFQFSVGKGSRIHIDNIQADLSVRLPKRSFAVVSIGQFGSKVGKAVWQHGSLAVDDVVFVPRELSDRDMGEALSSEVTAAIKARSSRGDVVMGIATRVASSMIDFDAKLFAKVKEGELQYDVTGKTRDSRHVYITFPGMGKMVRYSVPNLDILSLERASREAGFRVARCLPVPYVLMNGLLSHPRFHLDPAKVAATTVRLPTVLDESQLQMILPGADGKWQAFRGVDVFGKKSLGAAGSTALADSLRTLLTSVHTQCKPTKPMELAILNTNSPAMAWQALESVAAELNRSKMVESDVQMLRLVETLHVELHALCLHP